MSHEKFIAKAARAAHGFLVMASLAVVLIFFYVVYRHGLTGRPFYSGVLIIAVALLLTGLRWKAANKINLALCAVSLALSMYAAEAYLYFSNPMPYEPRRPITAVNGAPEWRKQRAKNFAKQFGVDFDTRDKSEVVAELRSRGIDAVPFVSPSNDLFIKAPDGGTSVAVKVGGEDIVPLGGIANKVTVLCNEGGEYVTYPSDAYGFNNPASSIWKAKDIQIVALGDSFAQGYCVPPDKNFVAGIRDRYPATLNLGIAGNGPLLMLATLQEYLSPQKPETVLWFYFEGNDLNNLLVEKNNPLLLRYLEKDFAQDLRERQREIDQALSHFVDQVHGRRTLRNQKETSNRYVRHSKAFIKLSALRTRFGGLISAVDEEDMDAVSEANMALFRRILSRVKDQVDGWGGELYFVYLPDWDRYAQKDPDIYGQQRDKVLDYVEDLEIPLIDIHPAFQAQADPLSLFPFREPNHYNEKGHNIIAGEVLKALQIAGADAASAMFPLATRADKMVRHP